MNRSSARAGLAVVLLLAASVQGCAAHGGGGQPASPPEVVVSWSYGSPAGSDISLSSGPPNDVLLTADGNLQIVLLGSHTCPPFPYSVVASAADTVTISTRKVDVVGNSGLGGGSMVCTADISPTTSTVAVPAGVDTTRRFHVVVNGNDHVIDPPGP